MVHAEELAGFRKKVFNRERPYAIYFPKRVDRATDPGAKAPSHRDIVIDLGYKVELAVITGREAFHVREEEVKDYIFGYIIISDVSARTLQTRHKQWYLDKGLDDFSPMGPYMATVDELSYPPKVQVQSGANDKLRRDSNAEQLTFDVSHIISELSREVTSRPGTIIVVGTPVGAGIGFDPPKFLVPGDVMECTIEGIGIITNRVAD